MRIALVVTYNHDFIVPPSVHEYVKYVIYASGDGLTLEVAREMYENILRDHHRVPYDLIIGDYTVQMLSWDALGFNIPS